MGCFNVAGTMSNISIGHGDPVAFIPLIPFYTHHLPDDKKGNVIVEPGNLICSNEGPSAYYKPRFLPIFGEYNDYGSVEEIKRDANVEHIEEYFGITIDKFMEQISRNFAGDNDIKCKTPELTKELQQLSGMFEHREVYDTMAQAGHERNLAYTNGYIDSTVLADIGFVQQDDPTEYVDKRYDVLFLHPDIPEIAIASDKKWIKLFDTSVNKELHHVYHLDRLAEELDKLGVDFAATCPSLENYKNFCTNRFMVNKYNKSATGTDEERIIAKIKELKDNDVFEGEAAEEMERFARSMLRMDRHELPHTFERNRDLKYALKDPKCENILVDWLNFDTMMFSTNNFYFAANNGEQHGNHESSKELYEISLKIINDKLSYREEW